MNNLKIFAAPRAPIHTAFHRICFPIPSWHQPTPLRLLPHYFL